MTIKLIISSLFMLIGTLFIAFNDVLDIKKNEIYFALNINQTSVNEFEKIKNVNSWIHKKTLENSLSNKKTYDQAEADMIYFYDTAPKSLNLKVERFIYLEKDLKMDFSFNFNPEDSSVILQLLSLEYPGGFVKFNSIKIKTGKIDGTLTIVQPLINGEQK